MKKILLFTIALFMIPALVACGKSDTIITVDTGTQTVKAESDTKSTDSEKQLESTTENNISNEKITDSASKAEGNTSSTASSLENDQDNDNTSHNEYTHSALEGCVIISSDKLTGECVYKEKCPVCGKTNSGHTITYVTHGTLNSGATCENTQCSNWGKHFDVKISGTSQLVDSASKADGNTSGTASSLENNQDNGNTSHNEYAHAALEGCEIISSDKLTGECVYKAKCPVCGKTNSGHTITYIKYGTLNSGATCENVQCSNWGKHFDVKISGTSQLVYD